MYIGTASSSKRKYHDTLALPIAKMHSTPHQTPVRPHTRFPIFPRIGHGRSTPICAAHRPVSHTPDLQCLFSLHFSHRPTLPGSSGPARPKQVTTDRLLSNPEKIHFPLQHNPVIHCPSSSHDAHSALFTCTAGNGCGDGVCGLVVAVGIPGTDSP